MTRIACVLLVLVVALAAMPVGPAVADTGQQMYTCPNQSHVFDPKDCPPVSAPGAFPGGGGPGQGGLLGLIHKITGGLL